MMRPEVFLSHAAEDNPASDAIATRLKAARIATYTFETHTRPGELIGEKLRAAIKRCDVTVVLCTIHSRHSTYVHQEIGVAFGEHKPIIPLAPDGFDLQEFAMLAGREYIRFDPRAVHNVIPPLVKAVRIAYRAAEAIAWNPPVPEKDKPSEAKNPRAAEPMRVPDHASASAVAVSADHGDLGESHAQYGRALREMGIADLGHGRIELALSALDAALLHDREFHDDRGAADDHLWAGRACIERARAIDRKITSVTIPGFDARIDHLVRSRRESWKAAASHLVQAYSAYRDFPDMEQAQQTLYEMTPPWNMLGREFMRVCAKLRLPRDAPKLYDTLEEQHIKG